MKGIILYKSNYGATRDYARWIAEETGFACEEFSRRTAKKALDCDVVIFGSPVIAGRPVMKKWIVSNWPRLKGRKIVLFTTSGAAADDPEQMENYERCFSEEIRDGLEYFPLGGRIIFDELKPMHRSMMKLAAKMAEDPEVKESMLRDKDHVDKAAIAPLVRSLA